MTLMTRSAALFAVLVWLSACDGKETSPTAAGSPTAGITGLTVNGTVFGNGNPDAGASVTIMDGIHAGQTRDTTNAGHYSFTNLTPSVFTLQAAGGWRFPAQNKAVNLTIANQSVDFQLFDH